MNPEHIWLGIDPSVTLNGFGTTLASGNLGLGENRYHC
jgi:hypothetical protein